MPSPRARTSDPEAAKAKEAADIARRSAGQPDEPLTQWARSLIDSRDNWQSKQRRRETVVFPERNAG